MLKQSKKIFWQSIIKTELPLKNKEDLPERRMILSKSLNLLNSVRYEIISYILIFVQKKLNLRVIWIHQMMSLDGLFLLFIKNLLPAISGKTLEYLNNYLFPITYPSHRKQHLLKIKVKISFLE